MWCGSTRSWEETLVTVARTSMRHSSQPGHRAIGNPTPDPRNQICEADRPQSQSGSSRHTPVRPVWSIYGDLHTSLPIISSIVCPTLSSLISGRDPPWLLQSPLNSLPSFRSAPILICTSHLEFYLLMGFLDGFVCVNCLEPPYNLGKNKDSHLSLWHHSLSLSRQTGIW